MSTFPAFDFAAPFQTAFSDLQAKAKVAFEKGTEILSLVFQILNWFFFYFSRRYFRQTC